MVVLSLQKNRTNYSKSQQTTEAEVGRHFLYFHCKVYNAIITFSQHSIHRPSSHEVWQSVHYFAHLDSVIYLDKAWLQSTLQLQQ